MLRLRPILICLGFGTSLTVAQAGDAGAVATVANTHPACRALGDFYWEIGDANGMQASGQVGSKFGADTKIPIASASKFVFGAYVVEKLKGTPSPAQIDALTMRAGYVSLAPFSCIRARSIDDCFAKRDNAKRTDSEVGRFHYNGGHDQALAIELGLGSYSNEQFAAEVNRTLGNGLAFQFGSPQPAGGIQSTPANFGRFLRAIVAGQLRMKQALGTHAVCTLPASCPTASSSPAPLAWHYSLNHWVEDDATGDGAFSSAGLLGFYPWITADRGSYGVLARQQLSARAGLASANCGAQLRKAWAQERAR